MRVYKEIEWIEIVPSGTSVKIGTIQRRLAWPLREGWHTQIEKCIPLCFYFYSYSSNSLTSESYITTMETKYQKEKEHLLKSDNIKYWII